MSRILETRRLTPVTKFFRLDAPLIAGFGEAGAVRDAARA